MARYAITEDDVFKFDPKTKVQNGIRIDGHVVFSCGYCNKEERRNPAEYDVFNGMDASGFVRDIGIGTELEPSLLALNCDERLSLSVLKVCITAI